VIAQTGIPGIPEPSQTRLIQRLAACPQVQSVWLFGSRAMGRHHSGSDIDLCLEAPQLGHVDRLRLMAAVDDLLLPWPVDLLLRHEIPEDLGAHIHRVGRCLWRRQVAQTPQHPHDLPN
jgi:predicted nucleotidyltransferase